MNDENIEDPGKYVSNIWNSKAQIANHELDPN
jgi:hypothetical protein